VRCRPGLRRIYYHMYIVYLYGRKADPLAAALNERAAHIHN